MTFSPRAYEFACHSKACAPPPAGKGGSLGGDSRDNQPSSRQSPLVINHDDRRKQHDRRMAERAQEDRRRTPRPNYSPEYLKMKQRERRQQGEAQINRARENHGMPGRRSIEQIIKDAERKAGIRS